MYSLKKSLKSLKLESPLKKNVFLYGRGGHAKSQIAEEVLKFIDPAGTNSYVLSCGEGLTEEKLFGGINLKKFNTSGELEYLVENSGSMRSGQKPQMLKAALLLKIKSASQANRIYISPFITSPQGFREIQKDQNFDHLRHNFITLNGGSTDIQNVLEETIGFIKQKRLPKFGGGTIELDSSHFEILVINDGEDKVDSTFRPIIKTHVVCLKQDNEQLSKVCYSSGGTYFYLNEK